MHTVGQQLMVDFNALPIPRFRRISKAHTTRHAPVPQVQLHKCATPGGMRCKREQGSNVMGVHRRHAEKDKKSYHIEVAVHAGHVVVVDVAVEHPLADRVRQLRAERGARRV